jgi:hypothetical protein
LDAPLYTVIRMGRPGRRADGDGSPDRWPPQALPDILLAIPRRKLVLGTLSMYLS